jgi:phosphopantothenoylcysteine decarboxylase/phosphopantothenate--cysteine ligase
MSAAVADYRPKVRQEQKIKKTAGELILELERTPDILGEVARRRAEWGAPAVLVGFAAETQQVEEYAREKLLRKGLDLIVANDVTAPDSGFGTDTNRVILISAAGSQPLPLMTKEEVAHRIWDFVRDQLRASAPRRE